MRKQSSSFNEKNSHLHSLTVVFIQKQSFSFLNSRPHSIFGIAWLIQMALQLIACSFVIVWLTQMILHTLALSAYLALSDLTFVIVWSYKWHGLHIWHCLITQMALSAHLAIFAHLALCAHLELSDSTNGIVCTFGIVRSHKRHCLHIWHCLIAQMALSAYLALSDCIIGIVWLRVVFINQKTVLFIEWENSRLHRITVFFIP